MSGTAVSRNAVIANVAAGILIFMAFVRYSNSYFSYFIDASLLFLIYDGYVGYRSERKIVACHTYAKLMMAGIIIFYGALLLSSILLQDSLSVHRSLKLFGYAYPAVVFLLIGSRHTVYRGFAAGLIAAALVTSVYGLLQLGPLSGTVVLPHRIQSFYAHPNNLGLAISLLVPFLVAYFVKARDKRIRAVVGCTILLELTTLFFTKSRGPLGSMTIGIVLATVIAVVCYRKLIPRRVFTAVFACIMVFGITAVGIFSYLNSNRSLGDRKYMYIASIEMWNDHKLLGVGVARWAENYYSPQYHPGTAQEKGLVIAHNMPIHFAATGGTLGLLGYIIMNGIILVILVKQLRNTKDVVMSTAALAASLAVLSESMIDVTIASRLGSLQIYSILGYGIGSWRPRNTENEIGGSALVDGKNRKL